MWIIDPFITRPSPHLKTLAHPFTTKVLWAKEHTPFDFSFIVFIFGFAFEYIKKFGGASTKVAIVTLIDGMLLLYFVS
jgi:hypothetical protein